MWVWGYGGGKAGSWKTNGSLGTAVYNSLDGNAFKWTDEIEDDLLNAIKRSIRRLKLSETAQTIKNRFLAEKVVNKLIAFHRTLRKKHSRSKTS